MAQTFLFISGGEIVMVMLIALLLFGSKSIPDIARILGKGVREFRNATNEIKRELNDNTGEFKKDIDNISSSVKNSANKLTKEINDNIKDS